MDGMLAFPLRNAKVRPGADHRGNPRGEILGTRDCWEPITVRRDYYCGDVVSLEVADHHTYFGDGIFTHNSWAGAVDAMDEFGGVQLSLTQSFRFGPALAEEANKWLSLMGAPKPLRGFDKVETTLGHLDAPNAVLFRTNGAVVEDLLKRLANNERVAMLGDTAAILYFVQSARDLQQKGWTSHHDLMPFQSWGQVQDYVDNDEAGADLKVMVDTIDKHGVDTIEKALGQVSTPRAADVTLSTAHKVKGAEWGSVKIGSDFRKPKPDDDGLLRPSRDLMMLAYVAITRAKDALDRGSLSWIDEALAESTTGRPAQAPIPVIDDIDSITVPAEPVKKVTFEDALTAHIAAHPRSALVRVKEWKVAITGTDGRVIGMGRGPASWFTIDGPADALDVREHHYRTEAEAHLGLVNA